MRLSDTHGTAQNAQIHYEEFVQICNAIVDEKVSQVISSIEESLPALIEKYVIEYGNEILTNIIQNIVGALETDINTEVKIAFDNANEIFHSSKAQKYISDSIMKVMLNELHKIKHIKK